MTCPPLLSSLEASKKPGCSTGPRHWTEGSGSGKNIPVSPATAARGQQGEGAVLSHPVTPALLPRKNWSSSWTVLEGGILTFFKDSKHSAASALVRGPVALGQGSSYGMEPAPMGLGQHPWDWSGTHRMWPTRVGWGQHPQGTQHWPHFWAGGFRALSRGCRGSWGRGTMACTHRMGPASTG